MKNGFIQRFRRGFKRVARRLGLAPRDNSEGTPVFSARRIVYEVSSRAQAVGVAGIGVIHMMVRLLGFDQKLNENVRLLKAHRPYLESDHILNIAYNVLCGGQYLEDIELRRQDEAYLNALGADTIPDPTTAGTTAGGTGPKTSRSSWAQ